MIDTNISIAEFQLEFHSFLVQSTSKSANRIIQKLFDQIEIQYRRALIVPSFCNKSMNTKRETLNELFENRMDNTQNSIEYLIGG